MADIDLPVWTVRPNWRSGIRERLEWLTDVLPGSTGNEQRRSVRISPRRIFDFDINPMLNDRSFVDLWLHKIGEEKFMYPLWHDKAKLSSAAASASTRLNFDNTFREFEIGGLAIIYKSTFEFEVVEIVNADGTGLDLTSPLVGTWAEGTVVHPLRRAYLDTEVTSSQLTKRVGELQLTAILDTPNDYGAGAEVLPTFSTYPIVTLEPNRRDDLRMTYTRTMAEIDSRLGKLYRKDTANRAFTTNFYNWQAKGREDHHKLRQSLYRLNGRQKAVWMPTFGRDAVVASTGDIGETFIEVEKIGYEYLGTQNIGRDHLLLKVGDDIQVVKINSTGAPSNPAFERFNLASALTFAVPVGTELSFIDTMRLDQDDLEIMHHTDTDGVCEVTGAFKSFTNSRNSAGVIEHPIPASVMGPDSCGEPDVGNPCLPIFFEGWYAKVFLEWLNPNLDSPQLGFWMEPLTTGPRNGTGGGGNYVINPMGGGIIFTFTADNFAAPQLWESRMQFTNGSVGGTMRGRISARRWDDPFYQVQTPEPGSSSLADPDGWFTLPDGFPENWYFTF